MSNPNNSTELGGNFDVIAKEYDFSLGTMDFDTDLKSGEKVVIAYDSKAPFKTIAKVGHADINKIKNAKKKAAKTRMQESKNDGVR